MRFLEVLRAQFNSHVDVRERRANLYQLVLPLFHEDGDLVELYVEPLDADQNRFRVTDLGSTLMRLSYTYELDTENKLKILGLQAFVWVGQPTPAGIRPIIPYE